MIIDNDLVRAAKQGDEQSFSSLYEALAPSLYKFALYTLGNAHDAEDVVSETFIEAFRGLKNLREEGAFKGWVYKILNVRCKRKITGYIKGKNNLDIDDFVDIPSDAGDISEESAQRLQLAEALQKLTVQERQIIALSIVQGYTKKEISEILSLPHGTVSSKLFRALIKLRAMV